MNIYIYIYIYTYILYIYICIYIYIYIYIYIFIYIGFLINRFGLLLLQNGEAVVRRRTLFFNKIPFSRPAT